MHACYFLHGFRRLFLGSTQSGELHFTTENMHQGYFFSYCIHKWGCWLFASQSRLCWWYQTFLPMIVRMMIHSKTIHLESQTAALLNGLAPESRNKLEGNSALSASVITARLRGILLYKAAAATDFPMKFWLVFSSPLTWHLDWFLPKGRRHFTKLNFSMD